MSVRAVHLDVVEDLSSNQFLMSLRRFFALYGVPKLILSDNAPQFHASDKLLRKLWKSLIDSEIIQNFAANKGIQWDFIVEFAPWMGGFYERLVGVVKRALKKTLSCILATPIELETIVAEVTAVVNSRPLVYLENEIGSLPLTPANFLKPNARPCVPSFRRSGDNYSPEPIVSRCDDLVLKWKRLQSVTDNFWTMWYNHYLLSLREKHVSNTQRNSVAIEPKLNTVVHVKEKLPRSNWKLGRISDLHRSRDGQVRSATVTLGNGKRIRRPLKLLFPIEVGQDDGEQTSEVSQERSGIRSAIVDRPIRRAAAIARTNWRQQLFDSPSDEFVDNGVEEPNTTSPLQYQ